MQMNFLLRRASFIAAAVLAAAPVAACSHPSDVYDTTYSDRHRWDSREDAAYRRWEAERRIEHIEYTRRAVEEQRAYWTWRHSHPE